MDPRQRPVRLRYQAPVIVCCVQQITSPSADGWKCQQGNGQSRTLFRSLPRVSLSRCLGTTAMTKARRKYGARQLGDFVKQNELEELRNRSLAEEEDQLQKRQRYVTGLPDSIFDGRNIQQLRSEHVLKAFRNLCGHSNVIHAQVKYWQPRQCSTEFAEVVAAVVEFKDVKTAELVSSKQQMLLIEGSDWQEQVLQMNEIGGLRAALATDTNRYVRLSRTKPPSSSQKYMRGGTGEQRLAATRLQVGSYGPDGTTLITELDVGVTRSRTGGQTQLIIDYSKRQLCILTKMRGKHLLVHNFRNLQRRLSFNREQRTLTFTVSQPPKILEPFSGMCAGCGLKAANWDLSGPLYRLSGDPTAPYKYGMKLPGLCPSCAPDNWLGDCRDGEPPDWLSESEPQIGTGLAGADGRLGRCFTYRLTLHQDAIMELDANNNELLKKFSSFKLIHWNDYHRWQCSQRTAARNRTMFTATDLDSSASGQSNNTSADDNVVLKRDWEARHGPCRLHDMLESLNYMVAYNVLALLSSGAVTVWQVATQEFQDLLRGRESADVACEALIMLAASRVPLRDAVRALRLQLEELTTLREAENTQPAALATRAPSADNKLYKVLRVHVTATRIKYLPTEVETGNRVTRHFCSPEATNKQYADNLYCLDWLCFSDVNFLRVTFGDEHGDRALGGNREEVGTAFYKRMYYALSKGLLINGQRFAFLAYSSSQLRYWSCWMVADPNQDVSLISFGGAEQIADAMRHWLGDAMTTELVPAKCAARLGQGFSTTVDAAVMAEHEVSEIPDVEGPDMGNCFATVDEDMGLVVTDAPQYCFSDGVGRISSQLLDEVLKELPFASINLGPISAIQVRFQGYKGVLSRFSGLSGRAIQLRPSMNKFGSKHPKLEVVSVAACRPAYLNRQVIIMMNYNGVPREVFTRKLEAMLDQLTKMTSSVEQALELLPSLSSVAPDAHVAMVRLLDVAQACNMVLDPLMNSCLRAIAQWQVTALRQKARLLVREGATLMGVLDEYGVLQGDEVFVQIQRPHRGRRTCGPAQILTGPITLAKHPVSHRGDTRQVIAVNPAGRPAGLDLIGDYTNVIVFSQHGHRPLPSKLAGADLDGDMFLVLWDDELLQPSNSEPGEYGSVRPRKVPEVKVEHLQQHFVDYVRNDNLGQISSWLLAHADRDGADCKACDRLAQLHSIAVDFSKTGIPASMGPDERRLLMPFEFSFPHWLEKPEREAYKSETVLGQMYDIVKEHPINRFLQRSGTASSSSISGDEGDGSAKQQVANGHGSGSTGGYRPYTSGCPEVTHSTNGLHTANGSCSSSGTGTNGYCPLTMGLGSSGTDSSKVDSIYCAAAASEAWALPQMSQQQQQLWPEQLLSVAGVSPAYRQYLREAKDHYIEFENSVVQIMNNADVCDVGEMLTCCVRWLQSVEGHQQWEKHQHFMDEVKAVFTAARRRYFLALLQPAGYSAEKVCGWSNRALEAKVFELFDGTTSSGSAGNNVRLQLAAAYMVVANKQMIWQQDSTAAGADTSASSSLNGGWESSDDDTAPETDNAFNDHGTADGSDADAHEHVELQEKVSELKMLMRLAFQWVVARELQELADMLM